jgi:magnesium transporter
MRAAAARRCGESAEAGADRRGLLCASTERFGYARRVVRVIDLPDSGPPQEVSPDTLAAPPAGTQRWIDVESPTPELLERLRGPFKLHPLAIDDCLTFDQRPKLEEYDDHLFIVIHEIDLTDGEVSVREVHAFLGARFLITVHAESCPEVQKTAKRVLGDTSNRQREIAFVYYLLADAIATSNAARMDDLTDLIENVEEQVLHHANDGAMPDLFKLKRSLAFARRILSPQRDLFTALAKLERDVIGQRTAPYFRDVHDKLVRSVESLDANRELLSNTLDAYFAIVGQRTNEIMKHLTALSVIFLPLTFVTGFFGQNFQALPYNSHALMWVGLGACIVVPGAMLFWFHNRQWL